MPSEAPPEPAEPRRLPEWHARDEEAFDSAERATAFVRRMLAVLLPVGIALLAALPLLGVPRALGFSLAVVGALLAGLVVEVMLVRPRVRRGERAVLPPNLRRFLLGLASLEVALMVIAAFSRS